MKYLTITCALAALLLCGCAGSKQSTYKTLATVGYATDTAVSTYFSGVVRGLIPTNGVPQVSLAYDTFQAVFHLAVVNAYNNTNAPAPLNVVVESQNVINTINFVK